MSAILTDFADKHIQSMYPQHGWTLNSQKIELLWFPILQVLDNAQKFRNSKNIDQPLVSEDALLAIPFMQTFKKLVLALRELHYFKREMPNIPFGTQVRDHLEIHRKAFDMVPLYVDLAYVYLRILADQLMLAARPLLFIDYESTRRKFKDFKKSIKDVEKLKKAKPICDIAKLEHAFSDHCKWFDTLRDPEGGNRGMRDDLEHNTRGQYFISLQGTNDKPLELKVYFHGQFQGIEGRKEYLSTLYEILKDFCEFCTELCEAIGYSSAYDTQWGRDSIIETGVTEDIIGFWPKIGEIK